MRTVSQSCDTHIVLIQIECAARSQQGLPVQSYQARGQALRPSSCDRLRRRRLRCVCDARLVMIDVADRSDPKLIVHKNRSPPYGGGTHNCVGPVRTRRSEEACGLKAGVN
jgi:hypothetical protein